MNAQAIAIHFADELCRTRALTAAETDMLCHVVAKEQRLRPRKLFWSSRDDRMLLKLRRRHRAAEIAEKMGRTTRAVETRLMRLKQRKQEMVGE